MMDSDDNVNDKLLFVVTAAPEGGWHDMHGVFGSQQEALDYLGSIDIEYVSAHIVDVTTLDIIWDGHL